MTLGLDDFSTLMFIHRVVVDLSVAITEDSKTLQDSLDHPNTFKLNLFTDGFAHVKRVGRDYTRRDECLVTVE